MKKVIVEQGTPEWHQFRSEGIGASESAAILGKCPYNTRAQLWKKKLLNEREEQNMAMRFGHEMEGIIRSYAELELNMTLQPVCAIHEEYDWIRASFDGYNEEHGVIVEMKANNAKNHSYLLRNEIVDHHYIQVQHQMAVAGVDKAYYFSYNKDEFLKVEVKRDEEMIKKIITECTNFWEDVCLGNQPELTHKDKVFNESEEMAGLIAKRDEIENQIKILKQQSDELKEQIIEKTDGQSIEGNNYSVQKVFRKGSIDYSKIEALKTVDLDKYRKSGTWSWVIKIKNK